MQSYITQAAPMTTIGSRPISYAAASSRPVTTMPATYTTQGSGFSTVGGTGSSVFTGATTTAASMMTRPTTYATQAPATVVSAAPRTNSAVPQYSSVRQTAAPTMTYSAPSMVSSGARIATTQIAAQPTMTQYATQPSVSIAAQPSVQIAAQPTMTQYAAQTRTVTQAAPVSYTSAPRATTSYIGGTQNITMGSNTMISGGIVSQRVVPTAELYSNQPVQMQQFLEVQQPPVIAYVEPAEVVTEVQGFVEVMQQQPESGYERIEVQQEQMMMEGQPVEVMEGQQEQPGPPRVVIVCTSADQMGDHPTGAWSEEITAPYYVFTGAGCEVYVASIMGGKVPIDQGSLSENFFTESDSRFQEEGLEQFLDNAYALQDISPEAIDCVWLAGGHGTCMDFEANLAQFVTDAVAIGRPVGAVCHGVIGLLSAVEKDGTPLLAGKQVTGFSNAEEEQVGLLDRVPFLIQQRMDELQAQYSCGEPWSEYAIRDGQIITGQNPQSSIRAAQLCVEAMMQP